MATTSTSSFENSLRNLDLANKYRLRWVMQAEYRAKLLGQPQSKQLTPPGNWRTWLILTGRGWGKTRTGAEDVAHYGLTHPATRIGIVAATTGDGRKVCIEGESGLLSCLPKEVIRKWNRSLDEIVLANGTIYTLFTAEKPDRLRGAQHHRAWCDEAASWKVVRSADGYTTWDSLLFGLRLGDDPRVIVTTTPKPVNLIRELLADPTTMVTRGATHENLANLAPVYKDIIGKYEGTTLGRQELYAEVIDDLPGALWTHRLIESLRVKQAPDLKRIVVAIDPSATSTEQSNECGIVVAGVGIDGHGYLLDDLSAVLSPEAWARRAVNAYEDRQADRIVAEVNNGGEMVELTIRTVDPKVPYRAVHASRGKRTRAEPVSALYEQGKIHHVGGFPDLEDQLCNWRPDIGDSPDDRMDALVWAFTDLLIGIKPKILVGAGGVKRVSPWRNV